MARIDNGNGSLAPGVYALNSPHGAAASDVSNASDQDGTAMAGTDIGGTDFFASDDDDGLIFQLVEFKPQPSARRRRWARRLPLFGLTVLLLVNGPASLSSAVSGVQRLISFVSHSADVASQSPAVGATPWVAASQQVGVSPSSALDIQPATADPELVYACWLGPQRDANDTVALNLAASTDEARSWQTLASPVARARACHLDVDAGNARHVLLLAALDPDTTCEPPHVFLSQNHGARWTAIPLPGSDATWCAVSAIAVDGRLYLWPTDTKDRVPTSAPAQLWTTSNAGASWHVVASPNADSVFVRIVAAHADGAVLALWRAGTNAPRTTLSTPGYSLWSCVTDCARWHPLGGVTEGNPAVYASGDPDLSRREDWGTLYLADEPAGIGDPAASVPAQVAVRTAAGTWRMLPPLPISEAGATTPLGSQGRVLGVGANGRLLVETRGVIAGLGASGTTLNLVNALWTWDAVEQRWLGPTLIESGGSFALALTWESDDTTGQARPLLWLITSDGALAPALLPDSGTAAPSPQPGCKTCR